MLFKHDAKVAVVVSPMDTFMDSSFNPEDLSPKGANGYTSRNGQTSRDGQMAGNGPNKAYSAGLLGSLASIPANHTSRFVMHLGGRAHGTYPGIAGAVKSWGDLMLTAYGKDAAKARRADFTLRTLGYSTDNGAFYYRGPEKHKTYEQTLHDVHAYAVKVGLPYQYALLDSWWYYKGVGGGVKTWEPRPEVFPSGLEAFVTATGWRTQLHNRYWSSDTTYAKQNGGAYDFIVEPLNQLAIPAEGAFWDDLLRNASRRFGMAVYEQDWLYNEFNGLNATRQQLGLARAWLLQMGDGAERAGATVQYCMTYARMLLQSVEVPAVSQFRASDDYGPGQSVGCHFPYCVYDIGTTSIFAWALGLAPSKDNFWSTPQPGGAYGNHTEPFNALQVAIAALSTGPVQPSDAVNHSDVELILTSCTRYSGTLLQPSRPAAAIDAALVAGAFGTGGPAPAKAHDYPVWATHTAVGGYRWAHVLAVGLGAPFNLVPSHLPIDMDTSAHEHVAWRTYPSNRTMSAVATFGPDAPLSLPACMYSDFGLYHLAPVFTARDSANRTRRFALLGEPTKAVPVSVYRFESVAPSSGDVRVMLRGDPGEAVVIQVAMYSGLDDDWSVHDLGCLVGPDGKVGLLLLAFNCIEDTPASDRAPEPVMWQPPTRPFL